jgi:hypothetical protein
MRLSVVNDTKQRFCCGTVWYSIVQAGGDRLIICDHLLAQVLPDINQWPTFYHERSGTKWNRTYRLLNACKGNSATTAINIRRLALNGARILVGTRGIWAA